MTVRCTCRSEFEGLCPPPCAAEFHHWQAMLEVMPNASIVWVEDGLTDPEDDVCHCRACMPGEDAA